jgi:hypothetical protein
VRQSDLQRDADLANHGEAFIDEATNELNFQPRRKLPPFIQAIALANTQLREPSPSA